MAKFWHIVGCFMKNFEKIYNTLQKNNDIVIYKNYLSKNLTTFKIGGVVKLYIVVKTILALKQVIKVCDDNNAKWFVIGKGSNLLVSSKKINMVFISLAGEFFDIEADNFTITCGASVGLFELNRFAWDNNLSGLEWSYGIPGTIAGAVVMNAGCFGGEIKDVVCSVSFTDGYNDYVYSNEQLLFGYRTSFFQDKHFVITSIKLNLTNGTGDVIKNTCFANFNKKKMLQPYNLPSAGSVFKKVDGVAVPILIEKLNLKGLKIGDAQVSTKHCGFIVNLNKAKSSQVFRIICKIKKTIYKKFGIMLCTEIIFVGDKF